jgi:hypothetical protein
MPTRGRMQDRKQKSAAERWKQETSDARVRAPEARPACRGQGTPAPWPAVSEQRESNGRRRTTTGDPVFDPAHGGGAAAHGRTACARPLRAAGTVVHPRAASRPDGPMSSLAPFVSSCLRGGNILERTAFSRVGVQCARAVQGRWRPNSCHRKEFRTGFPASSFTAARVVHTENPPGHRGLDRVFPEQRDSPDGRVRNRGDRRHSGALAGVGRSEALVRRPERVDGCVCPFPGNMVGAANADPDIAIGTIRLPRQRHQDDQAYADESPRFHRGPGLRVPAGR